MTSAKLKGKKAHVDNESSHRIFTITRLRIKKLQTHHYDYNSKFSFNQIINSFWSLNQPSSLPLQNKNMVNVDKSNLRFLITYSACTFTCNTCLSFSLSLSPHFLFISMITCELEHDLLASRVLRQELGHVVRNVVNDQIAVTCFVVLGNLNAVHDVLLLLQTTIFSRILEAVQERERVQKKGKRGEKMRERGR